MEALAQQLQDALGANVAVYLGSEWLDNQPQLPHVIVLPGGGTYRPPDGSSRLALADIDLRTTIRCKAVLFEEAVLLAEACYAALVDTASGTADLRLASELWGDYTVRLADLTVTQPAVLTRSDVALVRVRTFTQHVHLTPTSTPEVPNDQAAPEGSTVFD